MEKLQEAALQWWNSHKSLRENKGTWEKYSDEPFPYTFMDLKKLEVVYLNGNSNNPKK